MKAVTYVLSLAALALAPLAAAHAASEPVRIGCAPVDVRAFMNYIETYHPTLVELKSQVNCVFIVTPDMIVTTEYRPDNSRFFADMDKHGRITGGRFR
jgi:hypothetical protein